jgi:hypothetical protein
MMPDPRITVERHGDRLLVTIERRQARAFSLGLNRAALARLSRARHARPG